MPLRTETTVEYYFNKAYLFYCKQHDCMRISDNHEDSVLINGVKQEDLDFFISNYIEYVLEQPELKEAFDRVAKCSRLEQDVEDLTDCEGRPI